MFAIVLGAVRFDTFGMNYFVDLKHVKLSARVMMLK